MNPLIPVISWMPRLIPWIPWIKGAAKAVWNAAGRSVVRQIVRRITFVKEITVSEKSINLFLEATSERTSAVQKPHVVLHDGWFEFKFFLIEAGLFSKGVFCVLPLHISHLNLSARRRTITIERKGNLTLVVDGLWRYFPVKLYQRYFNSRAGESVVLGALAEAFTFVKYTPSLMAFGEVRRASALRLDLDKLLTEHRLMSMLLNSKPAEWLSISNLREEEGQLKLTLTVQAAERETMPSLPALPASASKAALNPAAPKSPK